MKRYVLVLLFFLTAAFIITWPLITNLNSLIIDRVDGLLITWFLNWDIHVILLGVKDWVDFYNANIFYPYKLTLAFSETMLPQALIGLPFVLLLKEPLLAYNISLILGLALTGFASYSLTKFLTKREAVSFFSGILFSFSTIHLNYMAHLQLFNFWPVVFAILFLLQNRRLLFIFFFALACLTTALNFYFLLTIIITYLFVAKKRLMVIKSALGAIIVSVPFLLPYFFVSRQWHYARPISDAINFSLQFPDLANVSVMSRLSNFVFHQPGTPAYFGAVFLVLIFLMLRKTKLNFWLIAAAASFILALGPALHVFRNTIHIGPLPFIPLPYTVLYYLLPGFSGFRTPSRWIILTAFSLCVAISIYFAKKITWRWAIILSALVILEVNFPFKYFRVPARADFPPEQIWLKDNYIGAPIIQFPIYGWFDGDKIGVETLREYYSTVHWHPMFNGYSGYSPTEWEEKVKWLQKNFPSTETIKYLADLRIKLVLAPSSWQIPLKSVADFPNTKIYEIY